VNEPEDFGTEVREAQASLAPPSIDWNAIDWHKVESEVRHLRQRIFKASQAGDTKRVRNLQKLMLRSRANTLVSVRRVTQLNAGRHTAGIDGKVVVTPQGRAALVSELHGSTQPWRAQPVRRVYIPKHNGKQRPLGIPVLRDRVIQARVKNALEPEWEAKFEPKSYGFRPGRSCQDAIAAIYNSVSVKRRSRTWVLEADLEGAFDHIDHDFLLASLGSFPAKGLVRAWLKAGIMEDGRFVSTESGTPQGGVISPLLLNIVLHGLEEAAGVRYGRRPGSPDQTKDDSPVLVRYADDFVVLCATKDEAEQVRRKLVPWLCSRGLSLNSEKTGIVRLSEGFDFLGFNIRTYNDKLLIKPSRAALLKFRKRLAGEVRSLRGANAAMVITKLNPIIRGWAAYYRSVVSKDTFSALDVQMWKWLWKWARRTHAKKGQKWIGHHYWDQFHPKRADRWVFGDRKSGAFLIKFAWTGIERHVMVKGKSSPDDPSLTEYWRQRGRYSATHSLMPKADILLAKKQKGMCPLCNELLLPTDGVPQTPEDWAGWFNACKKYLNRHHDQYRRHGGTDDRSNLRLVHAECHRAHHARDTDH
jgi:RNA-directed DNA polymerase